MGKLKIAGIFVAFFVHLLAATNVLAADAPVQTVTRAQLSKALQYYQKLKSLEVSFQQTKKMQDLDMSLSSSGTLKVEHTPQKITWAIQKPAPTTVILSGQEMKIVNDPGKASEQIQIFKLSALPVSDADHQNFAQIGAWLDLNADRLSENYTVEKLTGWVYRFTPKKSGSTFTSLEMTLHPPGPLEKLVIHEASHDEIEIHFGKPKVKN